MLIGHCTASITQTICQQDKAFPFNVGWCSISSHGYPLSCHRSPHSLTSMWSKSSLHCRALFRSMIPVSEVEGGDVMLDERGW